MVYARPRKPPNFRPLQESVADALVRALASMPTPRRLRPRRFPAPWTDSEERESLIVSCADGRRIAYVYSRAALLGVGTS